MKQELICLMSALIFQGLFAAGDMSMDGCYLEGITKDGITKDNQRRLATARNFSVEQARLLYDTVNKH
jgi:hypothetical protein